MPRSLERDTLAGNAKTCERPSGTPLPLPHPGAPPHTNLWAKSATAPYMDKPVQNSKDTLSEELTPVPHRYQRFSAGRRRPIRELGV